MREKNEANKREREVKNRMLKFLHLSLLDLRENPFHVDSFNANKNRVNNGCRYKSKQNIGKESWYKFLEICIYFTQLNERDNSNSISVITMNVDILMSTVS